MIQFFFGDKQYSYNISEQNNFLCSEYFKGPQLTFLKNHMELWALVILKQVHGTDGLSIKSKKNIQNLKIRTIEGDFLITNQKQIGLGLLTADCLPIIFYDETQQVIAAAHAGWRGSVAKIALKVINQMEQKFGCEVKNIQLFFGPAAQVCCYEVSEQFYNNALDDTLFVQSIIRKKEKLFFDNSAYNTQQLIKYGVLQDNICYKYSFCTMCSSRFCSYRQDGGVQTRNITVVSLK